MTTNLRINGKIFSTWTSARRQRGLKQAVSVATFEIPGELVPGIGLYDAATVDDAGDRMLTGSVAHIEIAVGPASSKSTVTVKSKTQDIADCNLLGVFDVNQFNASTLDAICRAVAGRFGVGVTLAEVVDVGDPFPDATFGAEKALDYIQRLARLRGVLVTDDAFGNLVLTTAGTLAAPAPLVMGQGGNVTHAEGALDAEQRFSQYSVFSQAGILQTGSSVAVGIEGVAYDGGVPRFRPWAAMAESAALEGDSQLRAQWQAAHRSGEATKATLTVPGWRAGPASVLWTDNTVARCAVPRLTLAGSFMIGGLVNIEDGGGRRTELAIAPRSAFVPEPPTKGTAGAWAGIQPVKK